METKCTRTLMASALIIVALSPCIGDLALLARRRAGAPAVLIQHHSGELPKTTKVWIGVEPFQPRFGNLVACLVGDHNPVARQTVERVIQSPAGLRRA